MVMTMNNRYTNLPRAAAIMAFLVVGLAWSAQSRADDEVKVAAAVTFAPAPTVRLPAIKLGGIRSGNVLMITENGSEVVKPATLAQRQLMAKPSQFSDFCSTH